MEPAIKPFVTDWSPYNNEKRMISPERTRDKKKFFLEYPGSASYFLVINFITLNAYSLFLPLTSLTD